MPTASPNLPGFVPPRRIDTPRLVVRAWESADAPVLLATIERNLDHLMPWIPWAPDFPKPLEVMFADIERFQREFDEGVTWIYGLFRLSDDALVGGIGLHPRIGAGGVEIGYWLDQAATGNGYVTEATAALVDMAFAHDAVRHIEIRCDPRNVASAAVPARTGFVLTGIVEQQMGDGANQTVRKSMVWRKERPSEW